MQAFIIILFIASTVMAAKKHRLRPLFLVLTVCSLYYGVLSAFYWQNIEGGYFLGVYWGDYIEVAALAVVSAVFFQIIAIKLYWSIRKKSYKYSLPSEAISSRLTNKGGRYAKIILGFAGFLALLVLVLARDAYTYGEVARGGAFLIFYQMSDAFIPALVALVAIKGFNKNNITLIGLFVAYTLYLGLRYRIVLLAIPLLLIYLNQNGGRISAKRIVNAALLSVAMLGVFVALTTLRSKFGGVDLTGASDFDFAYAAMAESNIIFGLIGIIRSFIEMDQGIQFGPVIDVFKELLPRFIVPDRTTGAHLTMAMAGLGSPDAFSSGTAHPYIGEFMVMFGWAGISVAVLFVTLVVCFFLDVGLRLSIRASNSDIWAGSIGLISAFFGYYFFSRGYLPQAVKEFIFVIIPYFALLKICERPIYIR